MSERVWAEEEIRRLVPGDPNTICAWVKSHIPAHRRMADTLLQIREELETATKELRLIATQQDYEMILDPTWAKRIAILALEALAPKGDTDER